MNPPWHILGWIAFMLALLVLTAFTLLVAVTIVRQTIERNFTKKDTTHSSIYTSTEDNK